MLVSGKLKIFPSVCLTPQKWFSSIKKHLDYSKVPTLIESDLEEQHVKGSGPGGSKIATTSSCVVLKHIPTGLVVKCQETRFLEQNRKIARVFLTKKLDNYLNGECSLEAQTKRLQARKNAADDARRQKMKQLKETWKQRENIP